MKIDNQFVFKQMLEATDEKTKLLYKNKLISNNLGIVGKVVNSLCRKSDCDFEDFYQEGIIGLICCIDTYDLSKQTTFTSYCYSWINGYILNAILKYKLSVKTSSKDKALFFKINKAESFLIKNGENLTRENIALYLNLPEIDVEKFLIKHTGKFSIQDEKDNFCVETEIDKFKIKENIKKVLKTLKFSKIESDIINKMYIQDSPETLERIGKSQSPPVTKQRVKQIEDSLKLQLKKHLKKFEINNSA